MKGKIELETRLNGTDEVLGFRGNQSDPAKQFH